MLVSDNVAHIIKKEMQRDIVMDNCIMQRHTDSYTSTILITALELKHASRGLSALAELLIGLFSRCHIL